MIRVKVCGITRVEDLAAAISAGADAIGFVVGKNTVSPRKISFLLAKKLVGLLPPFVASVAVCVPKDGLEMIEVAKKTDAQIIQVHGGISNAEIAKARKKIVAKVLRCVPVKDGFDSFAALSEAQKVADCVVLDSSNPGSGKPHDWKASALLAKKSKLPVVLAGGLGPHNVADAIRIVKPFGVDASTLLEGKIRGKKDAKKVRAFVHNAKFSGI